MSRGSSVRFRTAAQSDAVLFGLSSNRTQIQRHRRTATLRITVNQKDTESESEGDRAERREETAEICWNTTIRNEMRRVQTAH